MAHFYIDWRLEAAAVGGRVTVEGTEARHAVTVGRLRVGETIRVGNARGLMVTGRVTEASPAAFTIEVTDVVTIPRPEPQLWLAQALAKSDRDELAIQMATELGVDGVIPWAAGRSIVKWEGAKLRKHLDRWSAILHEASKQSVRAHTPELESLTSTKALAAMATDFDTYVLDPVATERLVGVRAGVRDILLIVGPEGGITPTELAEFEAVGASRRRLGDTVLRTSTAGPAAIAVLSASLGRW
ncbi:MAG TPA: 16S rRNA (uracil(1498)-N(3))-methyltransferase [Terrimesophilobacter sp.]|nr:16S rRNA (uracil(1498)-N(3))-methyltransferase [Terrimesophilobacter sp.]